MKKVVVFGGGTGLSQLLKGLKIFPIDITAVVTVCDDGRTTGKLRKECNIPAVGDLRRVIISLAETPTIFDSLFEYQFKTKGNLNEYKLGNLILTGLLNVTGSLSEGIEQVGQVLKIKGQVLPLTEDNPTLMGHMEDDSIVEGEHKITESNKKIKKVFYKEDIKANSKVIKAINESELIIFSMGSLYTSIIPNLLNTEIIEAIDKSKSKIMYTCNMVSQPGETDEFKVSDHIEKINEYLGSKKIDVVLANNQNIEKELIEKYKNLEQKDQIKLDKENIKVELISNNYVKIENNTIRHNSDKVALDIYSYLVD